ncbi:hypothetical protein EUGRSUZ_H04209 [Eucalyptus grandis]|uniref:Uncharacterized protein n=2 Tax=Eucalyptus grandis TaxID=71139 RepID=A0ACC3JVG4_EUCGR|nr:hypothetical protein EUGRSUZ_H04209 [Eucalyptus grandis]
MVEKPSIIICMHSSSQIFPVSMSKKHAAEQRHNHSLNGIRQAIYKYKEPAKTTENFYLKECFQINIDELIIACISQKEIKKRKLDVGRR